MYTPLLLVYPMANVIADRIAKLYRNELSTYHFLYIAQSNPEPIVVSMHHARMSVCPYGRYPIAIYFFSITVSKGAVLVCNHSIVDVSIKGSIHPYCTTSLDCLSGDVAWDVVPLELSITDTLVGVVREFET